MASSDLSQSFGRPATAGSALSGLLPARAGAPRPRATPDEEPVESTDQPSHGTARGVDDSPPTSPSEDSRNTEVAGPVTPRPDRAPRARSAGRELRKAPAAQEHIQTHQILVYISAAAKAAAERHRKQHQLTNGEIVLDALDSAHDDLPELIAAQQMTVRSEDSLFPARRASRRASSPNTRKVPFAFRATAVELAIMQDMVRDFGANSQSELVAVAMDRFLLRGRR
jgi:hypothetical protein